MSSIYENYNQEDYVEAVRALRPVNCLGDIPDNILVIIMMIRGYEGIVYGKRGIFSLGDDKELEKELRKKYEIEIKLFVGEYMEKEFLKYLQKKACNSIKEDLLEMCDSKEGSLDEIRRYYHSFPDEPDYNIAQYGNLLVYYEQVRKFYDQCGYNTYGFKLEQYSDDAIWQLYKSHVGLAVRQIIKEYKL